MLKPAAALVAALCFALPAAAQNVKQGGNVKSGDLSKFQSNGQIVSPGDTRGDANGKGVNPFAVLDSSGDGICFRTGASGSAHYAFCLGHDADGNALISVDALGGKPAKGLKCRVNGVTGDCFSGGGSSGDGTQLTWDSAPLTWDGVPITGL